MPKITISEKDLTINNEVDVTESIVFIPGMSEKAVADVPKRYDTAAEFIEDFGVPYRFISKQEVNGETILGANEYERSCIYAIELLTAGFPIYFYNLINIGEHFTYSSDGVTSENYKSCIQLTLDTSVTEETFKPYTYFIGIDNGYKYAETYIANTTYYTGSDVTDDAEYSSGTIYIKKSSDAGIVKLYYDKLTHDGETDGKNPFQPVLDRWTYNIKFITTGGYPSLLKDNDKYPIVETMLMVATYRGDAEALIDDNVTAKLLDTYETVNDGIGSASFTSQFTGSLENQCNLKFAKNENRKPEDTRKYGLTIAPGASYYVKNSTLISNNISVVNMPGSFAYLLSLIKSVDVLKNPDYFAIAGVSRGQIPNLAGLINEPTGAEGDYVQERTEKKISINPILFVQNYDYCIWGNRTLFPNPSGDLAASSFANIRVMSADVKKVIYNACRQLTFETNSIELWLKFKSKVEPLLEQMVANGALNGFNLIRKTTTQKATLAVYVELDTEYAVEDFDIIIGLTDATVEEVE